MPDLIQSALCRKYSGDLDSFYSRDIKYILKQRRCRAFIWFIDMCIIDEPEEFLQKRYGISKSLHKLYNAAYVYKDKILQPKICIEKFERLHCHNYNKKIMLQAKQKGYVKKERKSSESDERPKQRKGYSMMLLQLTREQGSRFENNNFLFGSKNSLSTIHNVSQLETEGLTNYQDDINLRCESFNTSQKINIKDILKSQHTEHQHFSISKELKPAYDESLSLVFDNASQINKDERNFTTESFLQENPFQDEVNFTSANSEILKSKFLVKSIYNHSPKNIKRGNNKDLLLGMLDSKDSSSNRIGDLNTMSTDDFKAVIKSTRNMLIAENYNFKSENANLSKKLQPTRITNCINED